MKYKLTTNTKEWLGATLYQIEYLKSFAGIKKGDLGGWIESEDNLSQDGNARVTENGHVTDRAFVTGNAHVAGNTWVSGDACLSAKSKFTRGNFIGGSDSGKITDITDKIGSTYWKHQYVLGEYEITPIEEPTITLTDEELLAECERRGVSTKITNN